MNKGTLRSAFFTLLLVTTGATEAALCMSDVDVFKNMGLLVYSRGNNWLNVSLPVEGRSRSYYSFDTQYQILPEELSGRIMRMTVSDNTGVKGTPHTARLRSQTFLNYEIPQLGSLTYAQAFVEIEQQSRVLGLVMLNNPECVESNRAKFETLLSAYEHDWPVTLTILTGRLLNVDVGINESTGKPIVSDISPQNGLIYEVTLRRPPPSPLDVPPNVERRIMPPIQRTPLQSP